VDDKITLDRDTFRALAADTRVDIIKILDERKHTLTDLSKKLKLAPSTLKEHIDRLVDSGLIYHEDKGTKWKYYKLTRKGRSLLHPHESKIWVMLATSVVGLGVVAASLAGSLKVFSLGGARYAAAPAAEVVRGGGEASEFAAKAFDSAAPVVTDAAPEAFRAAANHTPQLAEAASSTPYILIALAAFFALTAGACAGYLIRKKARL